MYKYKIKGSEGFKSNIERTITDGVDYINFEIESETEKEFPPMTIEVTGFKGRDVHSYWRPAQQRRKKNIVMCWGEGDTGDAVKGTISAPVGVFYDLHGNNTLAASFSNVIEDTSFKMGVIEETGELIVKVGLFPYKNKKRRNYKGCLRIDTRKLSVERVTKDISEWYEKDNKPMEVPELAKEAMYSTWYSYHQDLTAEVIEKEAYLAKKSGMEAVIVDDGWQTEDSSRGYAYCGDWEVSSKRIPDMAEHVKRVQDMGVKYLLWYSVPFMGREAKVWDRFKDKLLYMREELGAGVLDPRYKEVREFLIGKYIEAVRDWGVDGLKLDFVDEFHQGLAQRNALLEDDARDYPCVQEAVEALLEGILTSLREIRPDVIIEFRQRYIGPFMRRYGNIFRVTDCPMDFISNREGIADLRMFSGSTAIHSDMIMWDPSDTPEGAALQFASIMFGIPQFSMRMEELTPEHKKVTDFWLKLWRDNRDLLTEGEFKIVSPEYLYPMMSSEDENSIAIGIYGDKIVDLKGDKDVLLLNGRMEKEVYLKAEKPQSAEIIIYNCMGDITRSETFEIVRGVNTLCVPECGIAKIKWTMKK